MAFSFHQTCPNRACNHLAEVFVREDQIPTADADFHYRCPMCGRTVVCRPAAYTTEVDVPENWPVAQRVPQQASPARRPR